MNLDEMTVGQLKEVAKLARGLGSKCAKPKVRLDAKRVIAVVDRGWIFAGDQSLTEDGYILLSNAVHVFRWESMGFAKMVENWRDAKVDLRKVADVEIPRDSVIFRVPVPKDWGIR
jgi:hypothetical protein